MAFRNGISLGRLDPSLDLNKGPPQHPQLPPSTMLWSPGLCCGSSATEPLRTGGIQQRRFSSIGSAEPIKCQHTVGSDCSGLAMLGHLQSPRSREALGCQEQTGRQGSSAPGHTHLWVAASLPARNHRLGLGCPELRPQGSGRCGSDLQSIRQMLLVSTGPCAGTGALARLQLL